MTTKTNRKGAGSASKPPKAAANGKADTSQTRANAGAGAEPPSRLRLPLRTVDDVRAELGRLYRDGKAGRRNIADVSRLANVLALLGRLIEGADLEARVAAIEASRPNT